MNDFARLEEKLAKLRQRERAPGEGRKLKGTDGASRLAALVTEIDETILPRRLSFALGEAGALHVAVANRKLQALLPPSPSGLSSPLAGAPLADPTAPGVAELGTAMAEALAAAETVPISSARQQEKFGSDVGIPATQLARLWNATPASPDAATSGEVLGGFLDEIGDAALAWLRIEGEDVTGQGGAPAQVEALGELAAIFLDSYFARFETAYPEPADACGTLISPGTDARAALFFVEIGDVSAVILTTPEKGPGLATRWQKRVSG